MKIDNIEIFLKNFMSSWQTIRVYEAQHPLFTEVLDKTYQSLKILLDNREELVIGVIGEEFASGEHIFFGLSKKMLPAINSLKKRKIERIVFGPGVTRLELTKFLVFLTSSEDDPQDGSRELLKAGVKNITIGKLKGQGSGAKLVPEGSKGLFEHYEDCLGQLHESFDQLLYQDKLDHSSFKFVVKDVMDNLIGNYQVFSKLTQTKSHDLVTFSHLLNVGILSICLSDKLGFKQDDCLDIGMAGLFHDIGKLYIEKRIVQKHTKLSEQEFSQIESHTIFGSEILLRYVEDLTALPLVVAFEHHLGWKSGGYPKMLFPHRPHVASLIVSIADVYDALSQRRAYKRSYSSDHVYGIMIKLKTKKFAPELLDKFFQIMGVWSKGTVVLLEDDRVAIVREQNQEDIFSPKVELVAKGPKTIIDLKKESDIKIKRSLDPGTEGKKYLDLI